MMRRPLVIKDGRISELPIGDRVAGVIDPTAPYFIPETEYWAVNEYRQSLIHLDLEVQGVLEIDGVLIEV